MRRTASVLAAAVAFLSLLGAVAVADTLIGTENGEQLSGTPRPDQIYGEGGNDRLLGDGSNDFLEAGSGDDAVDGGEGVDLVIGGTGADRIDAGAHNDVVYAGAGTDVVLGGSGADTLFGQSEADRIFGASGADRIYASLGGDFVDAGSGSDRISSDEGDVTIRAGAGHDVVTTDGGRADVHGGAGGDRIRTGSSNDRVNGGRDADSLDTGGGDDEIRAQDGIRDRVRCGPGQDQVEADRDDILTGCEARFDEESGSSPAYALASLDEVEPRAMATTGLTVAVTGPTGDLGLGIVGALERSRAVKRIVGMARRPFQPGDRGWRKTEYRQGDVTDDASVRDLVQGADVVVHLAFAILSASDATRELNVEGSRRVFERAAQAGVDRICYASSVAAYGFHDDNPDWLTEEIPPRGSPEHPYSHQKAEVERVLGEVLLRHSGTAAYVFRPCIVAGPEARTMLQEIPYFRLGEAMPDAVARLLGSVPVLKPVLPDPGTRFQLVHEEDVASAFVAGVRGVGEPGPYNLAGGGTLTLSDLADALGWYSVPVPRLALEATAEIATRLPLLPESVAWLHSARKPVLMKTDRARRLLKWRPRHTGRRTLDGMVKAHRERLFVR